MRQRTSAVHLDGKLPQSRARATRTVSPVVVDWEGSQVKVLVGAWGGDELWAAIGRALEAAAQASLGHCGGSCRHEQGSNQLHRVLSPSECVDNSGRVGGDLASGCFLLALDDSEEVQELRSDPD